MKNNYIPQDEHRTEKNLSNATMDVEELKPIYTVSHMSHVKEFPESTVSDFLELFLQVAVICPTRVVAIGLGSSAAAELSPK